ncbi:MAG: hypothetical protein JO182_26385 [Acidobacteriaceae bacterium]|nr:hypothetical protein [Acidobacteriaceae bacterium]
MFLENQLGGKLDRSWLIGLTADHAETLRADRGSGLTKLHVVDDIEGFSPNLKSCMFPQRKILEKRKIKISGTRSAQV